MPRHHSRNAAKPPWIHQRSLVIETAQQQQWRRRVIHDAAIS
jgi:hypothetical protein